MTLFGRRKKRLWPISAAIAACFILAVAVAVAFANTDVAGGGAAIGKAIFQRCDNHSTKLPCVIYPTELARCPASPKGRQCRAVSAFIGNERTLELSGHAYLKHVLVSLKFVKALDAAWTDTVRVLPVLLKKQTKAEADQLASVRRKLTAQPGGLVVRKALNATAAELPLARRFYYDSASGEAQYIAPGGAGAFCTLNVNGTRISRMGCGKAGALVERNGTIAMTVVKGGYEVSGLLPKGGKRFRVLDGKHRVHEGTGNRWGGFQFTGKGVMSKLEVEMPNGRWRTIEDAPFPPSRPPNEAKPHQSASSNGR